MNYTPKFEKWWETQDLSKSSINRSVWEDFKQLAYSGWLAGRETKTFTVKDSAGKPCKIEVLQESRGIAIRPEGTSAFDCVVNAPIYLEMADVPVLYIWPDNNSEEFIKIPLGAALESK